MLTDPKTVPRGRAARVAFGVAVALLAALLIAPARTEFWAKVAVLGALALVCAARPVLAAVAPSIRPARRKVLALVAGGLVAYAGALVGAGLNADEAPAAARSAERAAPLPPVTIQPSRGVDDELDRKTATQMAADVVADLQRRHGSVPRLRRITVWLEAGEGQEPIAFARIEGARTETFELTLSRKGYRIARIRSR
jgi:hypothetical protein